MTVEPAEPVERRAAQQSFGLQTRPNLNLENSKLRIVGTVFVLEQLEDEINMQRKNKQHLTCRI